MNSLQTLLAELALLVLIGQLVLAAVGYAVYWIVRLIIAFILRYLHRSAAPTLGVTPMHQDHHTHLLPPALFGFGSLWQLCLAIQRGMPPWEVVPPILFGLAALVSAITNYRRARQGKEPLGVSARDDPSLQRSPAHQA